MIRIGLRARRVLHGGMLLAALACLGSGRGILLASPEEPKPASKDNGKEAPKPAVKPKSKAGPTLDWLTLEVGLAQVRKKYLPAIVQCDARTSESKTGEPSGGAKGANEAEAGDAAPTKPAFLEDVLSDSTLKDTLKRFVLIRVTAADLEKPYPAPPKLDDAQKKDAAKKAVPRAPDKKGKAPVKTAAADDPLPPEDPQAPPVDPALGVPSTIGARLGLSGAQSAIVVLNYWEDSVLAYKEGNPPTRTRLKDELTKVWKVNMIYAEEARKVEPEVEKSKYSSKLGNQRDAVTRVRGYEDAKSQTRMDPNLKKRVNELIQDYRAKAQKAIEEANKLDAAKKYQEAIQSFDKVMADFPFQDILQQANKRKNECLRKLTVGI